MSTIDDLLSDLQSDPSGDAAVALGLVLESSTGETRAVAERTLEQVFPDIGVGHPTDVEIARITDSLVRLVTDGKASTGVLWAVGRSGSSVASRAVSRLLGQLLLGPQDQQVEDLAYEALSSLMRLPVTPELLDVVNAVSRQGSGRAKELANRLLDEQWFSDEMPTASEVPPDTIGRAPAIRVDASALVGELSRPNQSRLLTFVLPEPPTEVSPDSREVMLYVFNMPRPIARSLHGGSRSWFSRLFRPVGPIQVQFFFPEHFEAERRTLYSIWIYTVVSVHLQGSYGDGVITEVRLANIPAETTDIAPR